jgi:hypothetical protein
MSEERRCQLKALLNEIWGPAPGAKPELSVVGKTPPARGDVAKLAEELRKAHDIIAIALNCIEGDARRHFIDDVCAAGLEGEGVTRANERLALLAGVEAAE